MRNTIRIRELRSKLRSLKKKAKQKKGYSRSDFRNVIRVKSLLAYYEGLSVSIVAQCYDVSEKSLRNWIALIEKEGIEYLDEDQRPGAPVKMSKEVEDELKKKIQESPNRVWVARHVYVLLSTTFHVVYSIKYLPEVLKRLGFSFRKASHYLIKRDSEKRRKWVQETLPEIYQKKIKEGWRIFYQDEVGIQTEGTLTYTWSKKGEKLEIPNYGRHGRINLVGAFEIGTGAFYGVLSSFKINAQRFRRFLLHLRKEMKQEKLLFICDNASFHKAKWLTQWIETKSWLQLDFLPAYSPDFNPIERLWKWMKQEFIHNQCWKTKKDLRKYLQRMLTCFPDYQEDMKQVMKKENERFKEICSFYQKSSFDLFSAHKTTA